MWHGLVAAGLTALLVMTAPLAAEPFVLSIDVTTAPDEPYEDAIGAIRSAGAGATSLSLFWDEFGAAGDGYAPQTDWPAIANLYYPGEGIGLTLTFSVIDTVADRRRADLRGRDWDDPAVIDAFGAHVRDVLSRMPDVDLLAVAVGNEVDVLLQTPDEIAAFATLLAAARDSVHALRPGVAVGTKLTFAGLRDRPGAWRPVLAESTALMVTYYPLGPGFTLRDTAAIAADLDALETFAPDLPLFLMEAGYPSDGCGGSVAAQADFVRDLLHRATAKADRYALVSLTWLTDIADGQVDDYASYYGVGTDCFRRFLGSLGLRNSTGTNKPAFQWLVDRR